MYSNFPQKSELSQNTENNICSDLCGKLLHIVENVCFEYIGGMCALFYENRLGIKESVISLLTCFARTPARNSVNPII